MKKPDDDDIEADEGSDDERSTRQDDEVADDDNGVGSIDDVAGVLLAGENEGGSGLGILSSTGTPLTTRNLTFTPPLAESDDGNAGVPSSGGGSNGEGTSVIPIVVGGDDVLLETGTGDGDGNISLETTPTEGAVPTTGEATTTEEPEATADEAVDDDVTVDATDGDVDSAGSTWASWDAVRRYRKPQTRQELFDACVFYSPILGCRSRALTRPRTGGGGERRRLWR
jgi:hypothetical protein